MRNLKDRHQPGCRPPNSTIDKLWIYIWLLWECGGGMRAPEHPYKWLKLTSLWITKTFEIPSSVPVALWKCSKVQTGPQRCRALFGQDSFEMINYSLQAIIKDGLIIPSLLDYLLHTSVLVKQSVPQICRTLSDHFCLKMATKMSACVQSTHWQ